MADKDPMTDAELQKLLSDIDVPSPDENEKISTLNMAESRFAENMKKNANSRQGNSPQLRPMDVITTIFITLTGGKNMKKSYALAGSLAIGVAAIALLSQPNQFSDNSQLSVATDELKQAQAEKSPVIGITAEEMQEQEAGLSHAIPSSPVAPPQAMVQQYAGDVAQAPTAMPSANRAAKQKSVQFSGNAPSVGATADMRMESVMPTPHPMPPYDTPAIEIENRDKFDAHKDNAVKSVKTEPVSTFSIDVDTASYAVVRSALELGQMPHKNAVRTEELINYFDYDYPLPESREQPFKPTVALYETPWNADTVLMHVGIKGFDVPADAEKPRSNLVFLLDVSGSMNNQNKLPLLQKSFNLLVDSLQPDATISIVTYAGQAGVALEPTQVRDKQKIIAAINNLRSGGSTAGAEGIRTAYKLAQDNFVKEGVNRVILATDGDFNVGITNQDELKTYISDKRETGIYLSVLGFGHGNYNDALMQTLAQNGNGNASYIDSINEARKVLVDEATSTLYPIANDVKIQVEFNPLKVAEYRLIGYESRLLNREDFNNDKIDAGDIGAGHTVTAIYEVTPVGSKAQLIDDLRYGNEEATIPDAKTTDSNEYAFLKMRYKLPGESSSTLITRPVTSADMQTLDQLSDDIRFAGAVAAFGQKLRGSDYVSTFSYDDIIELASPARGTDPYNYRGEFLGLVRNAKLSQN